MINPTTSSFYHPRGLTVAVALAAVLACAAAPAAIAQSSTGETVRLSTTGLDASGAGVQHLLHKIRMASVKVCASQGDDPYYATGGYFGCVRRTTADAVARAGMPQLTALYWGGHGAVVLAKSR